MLKHNTPIENYQDTFGLLVKREDQCCPPPGPPFSKTRGVFAHVRNRPEKVIGVLDTYHSQAGHAVAQACAILGKACVNYYPVRKVDQGAPLQAQQQEALSLGAKLVSLPAGRSAILHHRAKKHLQVEVGGNAYMMPNALKLPEMVEETAAEVYHTLLTSSIPRDMPVLIAISSGTIAAGVIAGYRQSGGPQPKFLLHQGYDRPAGATLDYVRKMVGHALSPLGAPLDIELINEGYSYGDVAKPGPTPPWACNKYYDLKAFRWWMAEGRSKYGEALLWNIG